MPYLIAISLRSFALAVAAWGLLAVLRVKSPAARHAVWTLVTAGMLAIAILTAVPSSPRVRVAVIPRGALTDAVSAPTPAAPLSRAIPWRALYVAGALLSVARLAFGALLARRLLGAATRIPQFADPVFESPQIAVPLTIAGSIVLPSAFRGWSPGKLDAVLAHERSHVRRADWSIAMLAAVNRSIYWFHPLAWWIERHLHTLAEHACDDAALTLVSADAYARALVEIAAALGGAQTRVAWRALAMAKGAEVRMRIDRILDDTRPPSTPITRARWSAIALAAVPLVLFAAIVSPGRIARAQEPAAAQYFVQGEVRTPGAYKLAVPTKVLLALVNAGGFREGANPRDIVIVRGASQLHFNYPEVIRNQNPGQNVFLQPGDIIVVP